MFSMVFCVTPWRPIAIYLVFTYQFIVATLKYLKTNLNNSCNILRANNPSRRMKTPLKKESKRSSTKWIKTMMTNSLSKNSKKGVRYTHIIYQFMYVQCVKTKV